MSFFIAYLFMHVTRVTSSIRACYKQISNLIIIKESQISLKFILQA